MFILVPIWHDAEQFPTITTLLVAINIVAFAITWPIETSRSGVVSRDQFEASSRKLLHTLQAPDSGVDDPGRAVLNEEKDKTPFPSERLEQYFKQVQDNPYSPSLTSGARYRWEMEYPVYLSMKAAMAKNPEGTSPLRSFGFKPADWFPGVLTYQFLHAGFLHILFNMLFLWAVGSALELRLNWALIALYLAGGVAGALAMMWRGMASTEYLVGASASIAALMGYAMFGMPKAKVKLFYFSLLTLMPRYGAFDAPLWFFVPLWLFQQVVMTLMTAKTPSEIGYAAHMGGFALGAVAGIISNLIGSQEDQKPRADYF